MIKSALTYVLSNALFLILITISIFSTHLSAQDLQWIGMENLRQSNPIDPSYIKQDTGLTVVLPGIAGTFIQDGPVIGDYFRKTSNGVSRLDFTNVIDDFGEENGIGVEFSVPLLGVDWKTGKGMFSVGYGMRVISDVQYSKDLIELYHIGNAAYIGETMNLGLDIATRSYTELSLGYARQLGNINIGARVKLLSGIEDLSIQNGKLDLFTDPDIYQLTVDTDIDILTAGTFEYNGLGDFSLDYNPVKLFQVGKNMGFAFDLGISGTLGDKFSYQIAALDIGSITWNADSTFMYSSAEQTNFEGIDLLEFFEDDQDIVVEDSLYQVLTFTKEQKEYSTQLFKKFLIGVDYDFSDKINIGGFFHLNQYNVSGVSSFGLNGSYRFSKHMVNLILASANGNPVAGLGAIVNVGPVQVIATTDNILGVINADKVNYSSSRIGLNVSF